MQHISEPWVYRKTRKEKSMPVGIITGASVPRSSLGHSTVVNPYMCMLFMEHIGLVLHVPSSPHGTHGIQGAQSHAIWHAWAGMEASQGDPTVVRYLFRRGLEANPRSRFIYLSWALFEKKQGSTENAKALLKQGHQLNPRDPAIIQVSSRTDA